MEMLTKAGLKYEESEIEGYYWVTFPAEANFDDSNLVQ